MNFHRNSQKRFYDAEFTYSVTSNTADRIPFFREEIFCELWIEELRICKKLKQFELYGFCLNHEHFHMLLNPRVADLSEIMRSLKTNFSRNANRILGFSPMLEKEKIFMKLEKMPVPKAGVIDPKAGSRDPAFWAKEHFEKIENFRKKFLEKYGENHRFPKFKWQESFRDHFIRGEQDFENQQNYIIYNFRKHGLPEDWKYTSLRFPEFLDMA